MFLSADDLIQIWRWGKEFFSVKSLDGSRNFLAQENLDFLDLISFFLAKAGLEKIF